MRKVVVGRAAVWLSGLILAGSLFGMLAWLSGASPPIVLAGNSSTTVSARYAIPSSITISSTTPITGGLPATLQGLLQLDRGQSPNPETNAPIAIAAPLACPAPIVLHGSIITGTSPLYLGRLIRNGVPSLCGQDYTCSGTQSTSTPFSYQEFNFINSSSNWQCVQVSVDARSCTQQVYSAAYLNTFNSADLCQNIQGAMGFSTSGLYGYSFMVPPATNFHIVNNTTGIVPPSSDCANYTMTTTLCPTTLGFTAVKHPEASTVLANALGKAVMPISVTYHNTGNFPVSIDASTVSETVHVSVQDGQPAAVQAMLGKGGAIVQPGGSVTQRINAEFSGSQFTCLPRAYTLSSQMQAIGSLYHCDGFNPPSAVVVNGSVLPLDNFDEDSFAFQSAPGTYITATVDTVSAGTAFDIEACISDTPQGSCLPGFQGDDNFSCTFPPPSFACPRFGGTLPADSDGDNVYYLRINSGSGASNFAGPTGDYRASLLVTSGPTGACPAIPALDNGSNSFLYAAAQPVLIQSVPPPTLTVSASVQPITIIVPPANPSAPGCSANYLPLIRK
jgi:hypothetical protein